MRTFEEFRKHLLDQHDAVRPASAMGSYEYQVWAGIRGRIVRMRNTYPIAPPARYDVHMASGEIVRDVDFDTMNTLCAEDPQAKPVVTG